MHKKLIKKSRQAENIRDLRDRLKMKQREMAIECKVSATAISKLECGKMYLSFSLANRLVKMARKKGEIIGLEFFAPED